uniref:Reverse transcriptase domain-containing protein n=1 Tax=Strongyloides venezuelensis TaxID=75913 RepID=A0A0K0FPC7_STRVS
MQEFAGKCAESNKIVTEDYLIPFDKALSNAEEALSKLEKAINEKKNTFLLDPPFLSIVPIIVRIVINYLSIMDMSEFQESMEAMRDTIKSLTLDERERFRRELSNEESVEFFDKIINELDDNDANDSGLKEKFTALMNMRGKLNISHLIEHTKVIEGDQEFMNDFLAIVGGGSTSKEAREQLKKEIGKPSINPPSLSPEFKKWIKRSKAVNAREEKLSDLTSFMLMAGILLSKNERKSYEELAKLLAHATRLVIDLRRKNLFEFFNILTEKEKVVAWSDEILTQNEKDRIKEIKKENGLKMIRYNAAKYANTRMYTPYNQSIDDKKFITKEIQRMLMEKIISPFNDDELKNCRYHLNPIFVHHGTKKDRIIVDCRNLNSVVNVEKFTYESIEFVSSLLYSDELFMTSIDLSSAYHAIYIHKDSQYLLCFKFRDRIYKFHRLRILKIPLNKFRERSSILLSSYLDDIILIARERNNLHEETKALYQLLNKCGFSIYNEKSVLEPSRALEHLGYIINLKNNCIEVNYKRISKILNLFNDIINSKRISYRKLARLLGTAISMKFVYDNIMLYITPLYGVLTYGLIELKKSYDNMVPIIKKEIEALNDLKTYVVKKKRIPVIHKIKEKFVNIFTDASNDSMGIYIREFDVKISKKFNEIERDWHINIKELHAIKISMDILLEELQIREIELHEISIVSHCDNMTARSWVLKKKGDTKLVHDIVHKIITCTSAFHKFTILYIPGDHNLVADLLSRDMELTYHHIDLQWNLTEQNLTNVNVEITKDGLLIQKIKKLLKNDVEIVARNSPIYNNVKYLSYFINCMQGNDIKIYVYFPPVKYISSLLKTTYLCGRKVVLIAPCILETPWKVRQIYNEYFTMKTIRVLKKKEIQEMRTSSPIKKWMLIELLPKNMM